MKIKVTKMQGCGNDFVIVDYEEYKKIGNSFSDFAKNICDRNFGVGADGLIIPKLDKFKSGADIGWYFYNSDGSTAQMCGNGMRCFAKYVYDNKIMDKKVFTVETGAGMIKPELLDNGLVKVNMGNPVLEDKRIPFKGERTVKILDKTFNITPVSMGNPHCVIFIDDEPIEYAKKYGRHIECHPYFPEKTNVEFVHIKSGNETDLCVFERGCGITLACGTGACATVVAGVLNGVLAHEVKVNLPGGSVFVEWQGTQTNTEKPVFLTGPCKYSFRAEYEYYIRPNFDYGKYLR